MVCTPCAAVIRSNEESGFKALRKSMRCGEDRGGSLAMVTALSAGPSFTESHQRITYTGSRQELESISEMYAAVGLRS